jgi:histidinol-phosphatase
LSSPSLPSLPPLPSLPSLPSLADDLALAHQLGALAAEVALEFFHRGVDTVWKEDNTPVSEADLEVDRRLLEVLTVARPDDAILSEESGARAGVSARRWILDPIDGTFNFVEGRPAWGTHVALEENGELVLGVITRPVRQQRWWATRGGGAFRSSMADGSTPAPELVRVSTVEDIAKSRITAWQNVTPAGRDRLRRGSIFVEGTMDNILEVIEGDLEAVVGAAGKIWDNAPAVILIEEAGGVFRDRAGGSDPDLGPGTYSNGVIEPALDRLLGD